MFTIEPIAIEYRNGIATLAIFRGSRRRAALRARGQTTSRGATRTLPADSGFGGRNRVQIVRPPFTWSEGERGGQGVLGGCATGSSAGGGGDEAGQARGVRSVRNTAQRVMSKTAETTA